MRIAVVGVGNILFKDEGAGVYASRLLDENYRFDPPVEIVEGGTMGFALLEYLLEYDRIILLDTLSVEDAPGSLYCFGGDALLGLGDCRKSVHEIEVIQMIEMASLAGMKGDVQIVGIVPEDIRTLEIGLSSTISLGIGAMAEAAAAILIEAGVSVERKDAAKSLGEIIAYFDLGEAR